MPDEPSTTTGGCEIQAQVDRNLIRIAYLGHVKAAGMKTYVDRITALLPELRPGFTVLVDLSGLESMELDCAAGIAQIMDACRSHGVGTVVRIIPDYTKDIGLNILSVVHYRGGVHVVTCRSAAEAERAIQA
jgi:hypothetical protein